MRRAEAARSNRHPPRTARPRGDAGGGAADASVLDRLLAPERASIMGVLNVTPDSFSDGGRFTRLDAAVAHAVRMIDAGAAAIDVGGESTRPGAAPVPADEELRRVVPVIRALRRRTERPISIDTTKAQVAAAALDEGADLVNDVSGGVADPAMLPLVARRGAAIVLMHRRGTPRTMVRLARYRDVVAEVRRELAERVAAALAAGVPRTRIAVDPGVGFAKNTAHNLSLLARLGEIVALGFPVVVGVSRKSFLGTITAARVDERVDATVAASLLAVEAGARMVRVHDVAPMARALRVAEAVWEARRR